MEGGVDLGGAGQRLLPEEIPLRFFGTASVFHVVAWLALLVIAPEVPTFTGGFGPVLGGVHTLTLGVLVMTAMGASFQMLPVALGRDAPPALACNVAFAFLLAGTVVLIGGFAFYAVTAIQLGAALVAAAVATYVITVARVLWDVGENRAVVLPVWIALASITAAALIGVILALDFSFAFVPDHGSLAVVHLVLVGYGFMGMLALGLSQIVVPLFAVALVADQRSSMAPPVLAIAGLVLAVGGVALDAPPVIGAGIVAGLTAAGWHVRMMVDVLERRMRRRLSPEFVLIGASWALLPSSLLLAGVLLTDLLPSSAAALFGFVLLYGWLLTLLTGVLQRIVPMLASMHSGGPGRPPVAPTRLTVGRPLSVHRWCHLAAVLIVGTGIATDRALVVRAGALVGAVGAAAFALFVLIVFQRLRGHLREAEGALQTRG